MNWENTYQNFKTRSPLNGIKANESRQKSFENFLSQGLPTKKEEAWKYTSLTKFKDLTWTVPDETESLLTHEQLREISKKLPSDFINFVFVNGTLNSTLSDDADDVLQLTEIEEADFSFDTQIAENRLLNLAQTFLNKKINLSIPKNKTIAKPVQIVFVQTSKKSIYTSEKINITMAENTEMALLVNSLDLTDSLMGSLNTRPPLALNLSIHAQVGLAARLTLVQLQNAALNSFHFSQCQINVESKAQVQSLVLSLGGQLVRNYFHLNFCGESAFAGVYGLGALNATQHLDNYTFIQHAQGHNQSVQHYKSVLSDNAHSVFRGRVLIEPKAQKADSEQLNNNLLLTAGAQADSIPQLEIFADDVKAGHGATFGQLNKDEIFYLLSRGINQYQATQMLSYGFAKELVFKIENQNLQNYLNSALQNKLEQMVQHA